MQNRFYIPEKIKVIVTAGRHLLLGTLMLLCQQKVSAQNIHITGGGLTIGTGVTLNVTGIITQAVGSTITNNATIRANNNWTNNGGTYTGIGGTVIFSGNAAQAINGSAGSTIFSNVQINQATASTVTMGMDVTVADLTFTSGKLSIGNNSLSIGGAITNTVTQGITGSNTSKINIASSNAAGTLSFDQATVGTTNVLKAFTLNSSATATIGNKLDIAAGSTTSPGTVTLASGAALTTGDFITLKSDALGTSRLAEIPVDGSGNALASINGKVTVERWISSRRAWRLIGMPVQHSSASETTIWNAWQEGGNNTVDLSIGGSFPADNVNVNPGFGTHITCDKGFYNSTTDGFDAASKYTASLLIHNGTNWGGRPANTKNTYITSQPGWMIFVRGSRGINLQQANYAASDITILRVKGLLTLGRKTTATITTVSNYNLISNPYASAINLVNCTLDGTPVSTIGYYLWDPYILGTYNTVGGYTFHDPTLGFIPSAVSPLADNRIESSSSFFVQSSIGQSLVVNEAAKVADNALVQRPTPLGGGTTSYQSLKTSLFIDFNGISSEADACGIVMYNNFSNDVLFNEDKFKLNNFSENLAILTNRQRLIVDYKKPFVLLDTVFFELTRLGIKNYHFLFNPNNMSAVSLIAQLEDNFTGTKTLVSLTNPTTYDFSVTSDAQSSAIDRFRLVFINPGQIIPVTISTISANRQNNDIAVQWVVQQETNMSRYEVERSLDGRNFNRATTVTATGNNGVAVTYNWLDLNPQSGDYFYRIKCVGLAGEIYYSSIVKVNIGQKNPAISIYPNPVRGNTFGIQFDNMKASIYSVQLTNSIGQLFYTGKLNHSGVNTNYSITPSKKLPAGHYQLLVIGNDNSRNLIRIEVAAD